MQAIEITAPYLFKNFASQEPATNTTLCKLFAASVLNTAVTCYYLSRERISHTTNNQLLKMIFQVTNPLIPTMTLLLSALSITILACKALNKESKPFLITCNKIASFSLVNTFALSYFSIYIHELGHALAALTCFNTPRIKIIISPFFSGKTIYAVSYGMTKIGSFFGKERALLMITASGFVTSATFCLLTTYASKTVKEWEVLLQNIALSQILSELIHAVSFLVFDDMDGCHDLSYLYYFGNIHPLIPISFLTLICINTLYKTSIIQSDLIVA